MRDIILIAGSIGAGKTFTLNQLRRWSENNNIPYEEEAFSDGGTLLEQIEKDDGQGGFYHYHEWCENNTTGHNHSNNEPKIPFTIYGNLLADTSYKNLFEILEQLPETEKMWFVEVSGGKNANPSSALEHQINFSFLRIANMMKEGVSPSHWLQRVYAIIHPKTALKLRLELNRRKKVPTIDEVKKTIASTKNTKQVVLITGKDDFNAIEPFFKDAGVKHIYHIKNTGSDTYAKKLDRTAKKIFSSFEVISHKERQRDIILVVGRCGSGKKTVLDNIYTAVNHFNTPYNKNYISDLDSLLMQVQEDDKKGGFQHYHNWSKQKIGGHIHNSDQAISPFTIISDELVDDAFGAYFNKLNNLPRNGKLWISELTGGVNKNPSYEPASLINVSFQKISKRIKEGFFPYDWLERTYAVIHPMTTDIVQTTLNETRSVESLKKIKKTIVSPKKDNSVFKVYGRDDFFETEAFFHEAKVPYIYHFEHNGLDSLSYYAKNITNIVFEKVKS